MLGATSQLRLISLGFLMILMITGVSAVEPTIEIEDQDEVIWLNDGADDQEVNFRASCNGTEVSNLFVWDVKDREDDTLITNQSNEYAYNVSDRDIDEGSYRVIAECNGVQSDATFDVDRLSINIDSVSDDGNLFLGDSFEVDAKIDSVLDNLDLAKIGSKDGRYPTLYMRTGNDNYQKFGELEIKSNSINIKSSAIPTDFISSDSSKADIKVEFDYAQRPSDSSRDYYIPISDEQEVSIHRWDIQSVIRPSERVSYEDLSDMNISLDLRHEGEPVTAPEDNDFSGRFYLEGSDFDADDNQNTDGTYSWFSGGYVGESDGGKYGRYSLSLEKLPQLDEGTHDLEVYFDSPEGTKKVAEFTVAKQFTFEGTVADSDSIAVDTKFTLENDKYFEKFSTNSRGKFSRRVLSDNYGFDIGFPKGSIHLNNVELRESIDGEISYDYFTEPGTMNLDLEGVKPVNMMATSFTYPFGDGHVEMDYNPAKTNDPLNAKVFECKNWNFWARDCISGWERIDQEKVTLKSGQWTAKFPVTPVETDEYGDTKNILLSAYVVGTNSKLDLTRLALDTAKVAANEKFGVSGTIVSDNGPVEGVNVDVELMQGETVEESFTGTTDSGGQFELSLSASDKGNYSIAVSAQKNPYSGHEEHLRDEKIWVYEERELNMDVPTQIDLTPGESNQAELTITNDGQTTFNDISLSAEGPDGAEFNFSDTSFESIEAGASETVNMNVQLPSDFCSPSCAQYPTFDITLDATSNGERTEKEFELRSAVKRTDSSGSDSESDDQQTGGSETQQTSSNESGNRLTGMFSGLKMDNPTGEFLQTQSSINIALGLITVFTLALAGAIKKKKKGNGGSSRSSSRRSRLEPSRSVSVHKPKVEPAETPEEGDEIDQIAEALDDGDENDEDSKKDSEEDEWMDKVEEQETEGQDTEEVEVEQAIEQISEEEESEHDSEESESEESEEEQADEEKEQENATCDICGEEFETEAGLKLHKEALHE